MTGLAIVLFVTAAITMWNAWALYVSLDGEWSFLILDIAAAIAQVVVGIVLLSQP